MQQLLQTYAQGVDLSWYAACAATAHIKHWWLPAAQSSCSNVNSILIWIRALQMTVKQYLLNQSNYHHQMEGWLILILVGWVLLFWSVAVCGFRFLNFQKR